MAEEHKEQQTVHHKKEQQSASITSIPWLPS